jgi:tetratricopeptide (TPR) repeat protein
VANVYASMGDGSSLGQARVEGVADSLHTLADRLSLEVLQRILESEDGPVIQPSDLSRLRDASMEAIRAYLEGEEHLRTGDFAGAQEAFRRAVEADSAFALAWAKLALAIEWTNPEGDDRHLPYVERALALGDRLPSRDRLLLKATYDRSRALPSATDSLEAGVGRWPDDPDLWHQLGEAYLHIRHPAYPSLEMAEHAFAQAVELDPGSLPYQLHYLEFAFTRPDDVAELQERMGLFRSTLRSEAPGDGSLSFAPRRATLWIPMALAAGTPAERDSARRVLRADPALLASAGFMTSGHPRTMSEVYELIPLLAAKRLSTPHVGNQYRLSMGIHLGRLHDVHAVRHLVEVPPPRHWECGIQSANSLGVVLPDEWAAEVLSPNPDEEAEEAEVTVCRGLLAAARDDNATYQSAIRRLRDAATAGDDSLAAAELRDLALGLEATRPAELGDEEAVATLHTTAWRSPSLTKRLGEIYLQLGRPQAARRILAYQPIDPHQRFRLGQALEGIGKFAEAIVAYSFALEAWESADPEWQPLARDVRVAIARLQAEID